MPLRSCFYGHVQMLNESIVEAACVCLNMSGVHSEAHRLRPKGVVTRSECLFASANQ